MTQATPLGIVRTALLSVHDKDGLLPLAQGLAALGVELIASGGTAAALSKAGLAVTPVEKWTGAPEILEGRVKTLHPKIHGGILADRRKEPHLVALAEAGLRPIDLVVCNLYPFHETVASGAGHDTIVENIDVGGPTMIRAAAKNADGGVTVLTDWADARALLDTLKTHHAVPSTMRRALAAKAFALTARYDASIANHWARIAEPSQPLPQLFGPFERVQPLRYGENPHQPGALYLDTSGEGGIGRAKRIAGKALSYNNLLDLDAAWRTVEKLPGRAAVVVKHLQPCGLAVGATTTEAFLRAWDGDTLSAFGGVVALNVPLDGETAACITSGKLFIECIAAPGFSPEALARLEEKRDLRLVEVPFGGANAGLWAHRIGGGLLVEASDAVSDDDSAWTCVTHKNPDASQRQALKLAWHAVAHSKSNAIALVRAGQLVGYGAGQTSRVAAVEDAVRRAGERARGAVLASDAFFPFADGVEAALKAGIKAVVQPGGSKRDAEVIAACDAAEAVMCFTGQRHFRH